MTATASSAETSQTTQDTNAWEVSLEGFWIDKAEHINRGPAFHLSTLGQMCECVCKRERVGPSLSIQLTTVNKHLVSSRQKNKPREHSNAAVMFN